MQVPANKTFKLDPRIPAIDNMRLIKYDFEKYGKAAECRRLIDRWQKKWNPYLANPNLEIHPSAPI